ncbi:MAG: BTAD domain-containing putative transcriptional regulator [Marmoricola sp.]
MSDSDMADAVLAFGILGPLEATYAGAHLPLGGRQQRAILALLVCETGHTVSVEHLINGVWGERALSGAVASVQSYVFHLRQVLEPDRLRGAPGSILVSAPGGYRLDVDPRHVDMTRFEELVSRGDAALEGRRPDRAVTLYTQALTLWRGDVLSDLSDYDFVAPVRARLEELRASALEARIRAELDLGHHLGVVAELGKLIADHALREGFYAQRIVALYRSGRQSDALAAYRELRSVLDEELGIEPSPPLQELNSRVLRQDPSLAWLPPPALGLAGRLSGPRSGPVAATTAPVSVVRADHGRRSMRVGALVAVLAVVAAVAAGAAMDARAAPDVPGTVPVNAVSEFDASGSVVASVPVGTNPIGLAAGDDAIWVLNGGDGTVSKVNSSTHSVVQVLDVGRDPRALALTGDDLWVTNFADGTVSRINVVANRVVDTIEVGSGPDAIAVGGAGLWVANSGGNTIQRIDITTGAVGAPVDVGDGPDGLAVDDTSVWVANGRAGSVMRVDVRSGQQMSPPIRVGSGPRGIARVGDDVWVADELSQSVTRISVATGHTHSIDVGEGPTAVAVLGGSIWVAEKYSGDLVRIDVGTEQQHTIRVRAAVHGLAVADGRLWVASGAFASTSHRGGVLRVAAGIVPGRFGIDPASVYDRTTLLALRNVYDGLLAYHYASADPQVLVPDLATSVPEPTDGGRTYTFNLRPGIRYSTGVEVRASDLVRGVHRVLLHRGRPDFYAGIVGGQDCIDHPASCDLSRGVVADDRAGRVTFRLVAPDPEFLYKLTLLLVPTPPETPLGRITSPIPGTGPYRIASFTPKTAFTLERNGFFRQWSAPAQPVGFLDVITWIKVADAHEAAAAVQQGRADLAELTPLGEQGPAVGSLVDALRVTAPSRVHSSIMQSTSFGVVNSAIPPFNSVLARRALNYAVDRNKAVKILGGHSVAIPTCQLVPLSMPSYAPYCPYSIGSPGSDYQGPDIGRARGLVRASRTQGMPVVVTDVVGDYNPPLETYFADVLRSLGYKVTVRRLPDTARNEDFFYDPRSGIQVETGGWIADFPLPSNFYEIIACATSNVAYPFAYCNRKEDRRAAAATVMLQTEPGAALRAWAKIDRDVTDQAPLVPIANDVNWWITSERVGNYQSGASGIGPLLSQLWIH